MRISRPLLAFLLVASLAIGFLFARTAQAEPERDRGWTVVQDNKTVIYRYNDRWSATATSSGMTFQNSGTGEKIYYYGTFKVEERSRDLK